MLEIQFKTWLGLEAVDEFSICGLEMSANLFSAMEGKSHRIGLC